jgi:hypothetical protein
LSLRVVHRQDPRRPPAFITSDHEHGSAAQMLKYRKKVSEPKNDTHLARCKDRSVDGVLGLGIR